MSFVRDSMQTLPLDDMVECNIGLPEMLLIPRIFPWVEMDFEWKQAKSLQQGTTF
jgi:hypothetical protein